jgi:PAS domain S-box-containing protein
MAIELNKAHLQERIRELEADNQALQQALERTQSSEKLHRLTLENIADTVIITDDDGNFVHICPNTSNIFGMTKLEVFQMGHIDTLMGGAVCQASDLKAAWMVENIEWTVQDKSGSEHFLLITVKSVQIEGGTRLYIMRDITARRQTRPRSGRPTAGFQPSTDPSVQASPTKSTAEAFRETAPPDHPRGY